MGACDFAISGALDPLKPRFRGQIRNLREKWRRAHPSRVRRANFEAFPGPTQFQVRTPEAILQYTHGGLRIEADWSPDGPWA
eukprot:4681390-Alexandrium_andersonii.AAC.1